MSIAKACELAGVSRRTIYNWIAAGKVEVIRVASGRQRVFTDTLFRPAEGCMRAHDLPKFPYGPLIPPPQRTAVVSALRDRSLGKMDSDEFLELLLSD